LTKKVANSSRWPQPKKTKQQPVGFRFVSYGLKSFRPETGTKTKRRVRAAKRNVPWSAKGAFRFAAHTLQEKNQKVSLEGEGFKPSQEQ